MQQVADILFRALRQMDDEADTVRDGSVSGLNWYGGHRKPAQKRPQTEPCWTRRLEELLPGMGLPCEAEVEYPGLPKGRHNRCDLVIDVPAMSASSGVDSSGGGGGTLWLEIKGAWKAYWAASGNLGIYESYMFYPLKPVAPGMEKSHTGALDLRKLERLTRADAAWVGLLLVGFDSDSAPMSADVDEFARLAGLSNGDEWFAASDAWPDARREGEMMRVWFWGRAFVP